MNKSAFTKNTHNRDSRNLLLLSLILVVLIVIFFFGYRAWTEINAEQIDDAGKTVTAVSHPTLRYLEQERPMRDYIKTLLVIGTDKFQDDEEPDDLWFNLRMSDFIALLVFDLKAETVTPIQVNRDTMWFIPTLSISDKFNGYNYEQMSFAHSYGRGREDSCENVSRAVSEFMFGIPVDAYICFTMDAVPVINDMVGGVTVTIDSDLTERDPSFTEGAVVTLKGEQALSFVRTRRHDSADANVPRMGRHRQYLNAFADAAKSAFAGNENLSTDAFTELDAYMCTDLSLYTFSDYSNWLADYRLQDFKTCDGFYRMGEQFAEFIPYRADLWNIVTEAVC